MANITYLLGAGASYNSLPVVSQMGKRVASAASWFHRTFYTIGSTMDDKVFDKIHGDLLWLSDICDPGKNFSVDTYAKKLLISGKFAEYQRLKNILSFYFTIEQKKSRPDVRYDNFWTSILNSKNSFPDNIKIISWNYDFQPELTYTEFLDNYSLSTSRSVLNVVGPESTKSDFIDPTKFGIFKLNGSATFNLANSTSCNYLIDEFNGYSEAEFLESVIEEFETASTKRYGRSNNLSFAWEHDLKSDFYQLLRSAVIDTNVLVVIGYSFPFFNRNVDKIILQNWMPTLRTVYFQAPVNDVVNLKERFLAIRNDINDENLLLRSDTAQFVLPNEM